MENPRKYGNDHFTVVLVHGGPGARGEMAPVARELSGSMGVLEPLQTKYSIDGLIEELKEIVEGHSNPPLAMVGFSWGAWLSVVFAALYPRIVGKLILVSSGPFEKKYVPSIMRTRLSRLYGKEREELRELCRTITTDSIDAEKLEQFGYLTSKADSFDPIDSEPEHVDLDIEQYLAIWNEAEKLRDTGKLLEFGGRIECPTLAIHGDYDPHPAAGVKEPLTKALKAFRFVLLENCGHYPWKERQARDNFFKLLLTEIPKK